MTVNELLEQLEFELEDAKLMMAACKVDYEYSLRCETQGDIMFYYGLYEKYFCECEKLRSAIAVIKERVAT